MNTQMSKAVQWWKNGDHPDDGDSGEGKVVRYNPNIHGAENHGWVCGKPMNEHGWIDTPPDGIDVCPGDYIAQDKSGYYYVIRKEDYEFVAELESEMGTNLLEDIKNKQDINRQEISRLLDETRKMLSIEEKAPDCFNNLIDKLNLILGICYKQESMLMQAYLSFMLKDADKLEFDTENIQLIFQERRKDYKRYKKELYKHEKIFQSSLKELYGKIIKKMKSKKPITRMASRSEDTIPSMPSFIHKALTRTDNYIRNLLDRLENQDDIEKETVDEIRHLIGSH